MLAAVIAIITSPNTGITVCCSHNARSSTAKGAANSAAIIGRQNSSSRSATPSRNNPNHGAATNQANTSGMKVVNQRPSSNPRLWEAKPTQVTTSSMSVSMEIRTTSWLRLSERLTRLSYPNGEEASRKVDRRCQYDLFQESVVKLHSTLHGTTEGLRDVVVVILVGIKLDLFAGVEHGLVEAL